MAEQNIRIMCPSLTCRKILAVPNTARGKTVRCKNCGTNIRIPMPAAKSQAAPPPSETAEQPASE